MQDVDITVIGGGINGVSVAAEAASRGLKTLLVHTGDIASSASAAPATLAGTHLQHLSALDYFQLNSMLDELQRLRTQAPHLIELLPVTNIAGEAIKEKGHSLVEKYFQGLRDKAFASVCGDKLSPAAQSLAARIKPSRLILAKAQQAQKYGAEILTYHKVINALRNENSWQLELESQQEKSEPHKTLTSKLIINCSGYWANELLEEVLKVKTRCHATKEHRTQFFFKNPLPAANSLYPQNFVLKLQGESRHAYYVYAIDDQVLAFGPRKCDQQGYEECIDLMQDFIDTWNNNALKNGLETRLTRDHFIHKRKAKLALIADPCSTNDSPMTAPLLDLDNPGKKGVLLNIFGVDPALHRKVAQQALDVLQPFTKKRRHARFTDEILPGGDITQASLAEFIEALCDEFSQLPRALLHRLAHNYGNLTYVVLGHCKSVNLLGKHFGHHLYEREVRYLMDMEWAINADDIVWRRTLLGIEFNPAEIEALNAWMQANQSV